MFFLSSCINEKGPDPVDCTVNPVTIESISTQSADCGSENGSITIFASGGTTGYRYSLDDENFQTSNVFNDLGAGDYTVTVKDVNDCFVSATAKIESEAGLTVLSETTDSGCGSSEGRIEISVSGGEGPYQFKIENGDFQSQNVFSGLSGGEYDITVKDANNCEIKTSTLVKSGISLDDEVLPILIANCAISGCHDGGGSLRNWSVKTTVIAAAAEIKLRTGNKTMPPGGAGISDEEIALIACWVNDGAPNN